MHNQACTQKRKLREGVRTVKRALGNEVGVDRLVMTATTRLADIDVMQ